MSERAPAPDDAGEEPRMEPVTCPGCGIDRDPEVCPNPAGPCYDFEKLYPDRDADGI